MPTNIREALEERFLRYSRITSQSDARATTVPSSEGQWELARLLRDELAAAGAEDIHLSDTCVLTARIPSTLPAGRTAPTFGLCTHLDTVDVSLSPDVKARGVDYAGGDILLNEKLGVWLREAEHPELARYAGDRLIVTDGTSVLGADDKAGITAVMEAAMCLLTDPSSEHGEIILAFVPDEEIGLRGVRTMDMERFAVDFAYTLDSCELGEIVETTFNAATARITITGVTAHPMNSKGILLNPILLAHELISHLDPAETPECTEGREAYIWVNGIEGNQSTCTLTLSIRDHAAAGYEEKKARLASIAARVGDAHPRARIDVEIEDVYRNIEDAKTEHNRMATEHLRGAMAQLGITPIELAMRGGTDGSWLSSQGIFTPNFFTGAHNFHSIAEFLPVSSLEKSYEMVLALAGRIAAHGEG